MTISIARAGTVVLGLMLAMTMSSQTSAQSRTVIAFGSCVHQDRPQPIWQAVLADAPEVFVFLGDNIYGDSEDPAVLQSKYEQLGAVEGFRRLREQADVVAIWDDHDYGVNDGGIEYPAKEASRQVMLDFWNEPEDSVRRSRPDGIYTAYEYGEAGQKVQLILLDLRWNRTSLVEIEDTAKREARLAQDMGPYDADLSAAATMLGETQWQWLQQQLEVAADLRIIGSSIQLLADFTGWESWANFPAERQRFFELLQAAPRVPTVIISGDTHWSEVSRIDDAGLPYALVELTSSGLTEEWHAISPNRHRVGEAFAVANYGLLEVDWSGDSPVLDMSIRDESGATLLQQTVSF
ncbi:alkaline phosphatase D family protein [Pseudohongiella sp.]|uniref:PhoD-like phosphatase metallophosphatase domain-containing protein n=1 Tax=marine sediment metagenome TaxID=412755 RepID=A0A0F9VPH3_9ZZZZ|nr:alkaline phosphatase D family protein [Pseudohongiella sp.]